MHKETTGQGSLPEVPVVAVPCERCGREIALEGSLLPLVCPHCAYHLRPKNNSVLSHFSFVLRYRLFRWKGRCTRKEYWSYSLIALLFYLLLLCIAGLLMEHLPFGSLLFVGFGVLLYILLLGIPQIFLIARRLHDISISGITVLIHMGLVFIMIVFMVLTFSIPFDTARIDAQLNFTQEYSTATEYKIEENEISYRSPEELDHLHKTDPAPPLLKAFILIETFLNIGVQGLNLFFLVICFVDSSRGTNKYGPSRKYPLFA